LLDNRADAELFVGREAELRALSAAAAAGLNTLVVGAPGIGKTSLLRAWGYRSRSRPGRSKRTASSEVAFVGAEGVTAPAELLRRVAIALASSTNAPTAAPAAAPTPAPASAGDPDALLAWIAERPRAATSVLLIDDVTAAAGHGLFGRLRDELWGLGYVWVVSVRPSERGGLTLPPADAFFERTLELGPLPAAAVAELVGKRANLVAQRWAQRLAEASDGNPRRVLDTLRGLLDATGRPRGSIEAAVTALKRRDDAIAALGRSEVMLAGALDALGAASASDQALLEQLGWTRPRAVQVLTRLEQAGLVRSETARLGPGRPRKVFRLTSAADYAAAHASE
jgi:DNA-binding MarR family transcriptional regulator